ncbi:LacI family DNA-binding transcriptional regulator [Erwinia sp. SLM-02]|uniref:LacI family DNA-binding transcriptional regulator n=1 Tax=Erwinia sp. SLM-02 TaxID=3020057 RepID=UPI0030802441
MASDNKNWITAADVARHAGVSRSAVSRTFTPGASVSKQTRQRVLASASELGYQVNIIARTMITGSSNFVGIITSSFENPFMSRLLGSLIHQLTLHGLMPLLLNINGLHQLEPALRRLLSYHITGVIMTSGAPPLALAREYLAKKIPVVLINRYACLPGIDRICSDNEQGASLVAALFREENLQRLAFIGENRHSFNTAERWRVFRAALPATPPAAHFCDRDSYQCGWEAAEKLVSARQDLQGIFCASDVLAMGVMDYLRQSPQNAAIKVVGYDDIPQAGFAAYQLTTVHQDTDRLALFSVDSLLKRIENFARPTLEQSVPVSLVRRCSA